MLSNVSPFRVCFGFLSKPRVKGPGLSTHDSSELSKLEGCVSENPWRYAGSTLGIRIFGILYGIIWGLLRKIHSRKVYQQELEVRFSLVVAGFLKVAGPILLVPTVTSTQPWFDK